MSSSPSSPSLPKNPFMAVQAMVKKHVNTGPQGRLAPPPHIKTNMSRGGKRKYKTRRNHKRTRRNHKRTRRNHKHTRRTSK
jgi:hypothetical protein